MWSKEEVETLSSLCSGNAETYGDAESAFWKRVAAELPRRTSRACRLKWYYMRAGDTWIPSEPTVVPETQQAAGDVVAPKKWKWSQEELRKLEKCRPPREGVDKYWDEIATRMPGRSGEACKSAFSKHFRAAALETRIEVHDHPEMSASAADENNRESVQGDTKSEEVEGDIRNGSNGDGQAML